MVTVFDDNSLGYRPLRLKGVTEQMGESVDDDALYLVTHYQHLF